MKWHLLPLPLALIAASGFGALSLTRRAQGRPRPGIGLPEIVQAKVRILVAKRRIPMGTRIWFADDWFAEADLPRNQAPPRALTSLQPVLQHRLNKTLSVGQPLTMDDILWPCGSPPGLDIAPDRAFAIHVRADRVSEWLVPGCRVDVLLDGAAGDCTVAQQVVIRDSMILGMSPRWHKESDHKDNPKVEVILRLSPEDAERLSVAVCSPHAELRLVWAEPRKMVGAVYPFSGQW
jgi:Flp pilus assembly protein CpaB